MPSAVFAKLNLKDQREIFVLNAPASFEPEIDTLKGVTVRRKVAAASKVRFAIAFVTSQPELDAAAKTIAPAVDGDAVVWIAYPKATSKKYTSTLTRESGSSVFAHAGFEAVRMIAIDEDWTAKRLRRADYIKTMTRSPEWAASKAGKAKAARNTR
jgi:hypothetical protein